MQLDIRWSSRSHLNIPAYNFYRGSPLLSNARFASLLFDTVTSGTATDTLESKKEMQNMLLMIKSGNDLASTLPSK